MRNILKYLITMLLTAIPVLSVVACSKNDNISESSEEKAIVDPIDQAKNLIKEELSGQREKIYTASSLGLNDSQIRSTMTPLVSQAQAGNSAVHLKNNEKISEQILQILQNDLIGSINRKLRDKMIYFANISNPISFTKDKSRFMVTKVSFDQMIRVLGNLKKRQSDNLNSQPDGDNKYYVYKLQLWIELDLVLKQGQATHNIYLDIYLTQDKTAFENKISELTALVREHIKANVTFDLEELEFQALSETNIKKQILNRINSNNQEKLSISNTGLKRNLLINSLNSTTNSKEYLEFLKNSDGVAINTKISNFITKDKEFQKLNSDFDSAPDNKKIFLGSFNFTFWNATYFDLPLQRIELKDNRITVSKGAFATQLLNISEVLNYYFSKVFSEKKKFRGANNNSVYLIVPSSLWKSYVDLTNGTDGNKVFNINKKMNKIFQDTIEEHNKKLLQESRFKGFVFKSLTDEIKILVSSEQSIGAYRGHSGLNGASVQLEVGFFTLNIIKNVNFWYGLAT